MRIVTTVLTAMTFVVVAVCLSQAQVRSSQARAPCPEGRTASGECVDPVLADMNAQRGMAFTQSNLSYTAPPFLPNADRTLPRSAKLS